ncbi:hypothetical protein [Corynebacterium sp.]
MSLGRGLNSGLVGPVEGDDVLPDTASLAASSIATAGLTWAVAW